MTRIATLTSLAFPLLLSAPAWADGDSAHGKVLFGRCIACHSLDAGKNGVGPSLNGVYDRKSGTVEGYQYSKAMAAANLTWDDATLDKFLTSPMQAVPGTKMPTGVPNAMDRADIIAFLRLKP